MSIPDGDRLTAATRYNKVAGPCATADGRYEWDGHRLIYIGPDGKENNVGPAQSADAAATLVGMHRDSLAKQILIDAGRMNAGRSRP